MAPTESRDEGMTVWAAPRLRSVDPTTEEVIEEFDWSSPAEVEAAVAGASRAVARHAGRGPVERAEWLRGAAARLRSQRDQLADVATREMGKTRTEARAEVEKCATAFEHYARVGPELLADVDVASDARRSVVAFEPLGPILAVMPWNFPYWQVVRHAAPALLAGNAILLKHAPSTTRCGLELAELLRAAGVPEGLFSVLRIDTDVVAGVIADPRVRGVTVTGSPRAGSAVARVAGEHLKKTVLELGGSDAFIVLDDADLPAAVDTALGSRFQNCGQSCIAAKRFLVHEAVGEEFEERFAKGASQLVVGDPHDAATQLGPMARDDLRETLEHQYAQAIDAGARLLCGGGRGLERGWYHQPTVLAECDPNMLVMREETFGPLAAVMRVRDEDAAVAVANASGYGLGGNVWTGDAERGLRVARRLESGSAFVNGMTHSDPRLPFGGIKRSGHGRELGDIGLREFVNVRTLWVG